MKTKNLLVSILASTLLVTMMPLDVMQLKPTAVINNKNQAEKPQNLLACWNLLDQFFNNELDLEVIGEDYTFKNIVAIVTHTLQLTFGTQFFHHGYYPTDEQANKRKDSDEIIMIMPANNDYKEHIGPVLGTKKLSTGYLPMKLISRFGTKIFTLKLKNIIWYRDAERFKKWVNFLKNNPIPLNFLAIKNFADLCSNIDKVKEKVVGIYKMIRIYENLYNASVLKDILNKKQFVKENDQTEVETTNVVRINVCPGSYDRTSEAFKLTFINSL